MHTACCAGGLAWQSATSTRSETPSPSVSAFLRLVSQASTMPLQFLSSLPSTSPSLSLSTSTKSAMPSPSVSTMPSMASGMQSPSESRSR